MLLLITSSLVPPKVYYFIIRRGQAPEKEYDPTATINFDGYQLQKQIAQMRTEFSRFLKQKINEMGNSNPDRVMHQNTKKLISKKNFDMWKNTFDNDARYLVNALQHLMAKGYNQESSMKKMQNFAKDLFVIRKNVINERSNLGDSTNKALDNALTISYIDMVTQGENLLSKYFD